MYLITLRMARENCGLTDKQAARKYGIDVRTLRRWEQNCGPVNFDKIFKLLAMYRISFSHVWIGPEDQCPYKYEKAAPTGMGNGFK